MSKLSCPWCHFLGVLSWQCYPDCLLHRLPLSRHSFHSCSVPAVPSHSSCS
jgi:hypothetical protein